MYLQYYLSKNIHLFLIVIFHLLLRDLNLDYLLSAKAPLSTHKERGKQLPVCQGKHDLSQMNLVVSSS